MKKELLLLVFIINLSFANISQTIISLNKSNILNLEFRPFKKPVPVFPKIVKKKADISHFNYKGPLAEFGQPKILDITCKVENESEFKRPIKYPAKFIILPFKPDYVKKFETLFYKDNSLENIKYTDISHGFFSNNISSITEDKSGLIYFSSEDNGICRFSGNKLEVFNINSKLPSNKANYIFCDSQNRVWVTTSAGICYTYDNKLFIPENNDLFFGDTESIVEDKWNNIWICTKSKGAIRFDGDSFEVHNTETGLSSNNIKNVLILDNETWFAYDGNGFSRHKDKKINRYFYNSITKVIAFLEDSEKTVWITFFDRDVIRFRNGRFYEYPLFKDYSERIFDIKENSGGIWFAIYKKGLLNLKNEKYTYYDTESGLASNLAYRIHIDQSQNVWIAHLSRGVSRLDQHMFKCYPDNYFQMAGVMNFIEDNDRNLWFLPDGGNLLKTNSSSFSSYQIESEKKNIMLRHSMAGQFDNDGNFWLGTLGHGILKIKNRESEFHFFENSNSISDVEKSNDGSIWFSFYNDELIHYTKDKFLSYNNLRDANCRNITTITEIDGNALWVGSQEDGIIILKNDSIAYLNSSDGLCSNQINSIFQDKQKRTWIGTYNGINMIDNKNIYTIKTDQGLISNSINCIIQDSSMNIWVAGNNGISRLKFIDKNRLQIRNFNKTYGLNIIDFINTAVATSKGEIFFSTHNKIVKYMPEHEHINHSSPKLYIEELIIKDSIVKDIDTGKIYEIKAGYNVKVDVNAIDWGFENTFQYQYSYIKQGKSSPIFNLNNNTQIIFSDMPYGEYLVIITVKDINNKRGEIYLKLKFLPYWWQTTFFEIAVAILIVLIIIIAFYIRNLKAIKIQEKLENEVMKKTKELLEENKIKDTLINEVHHRVKNNLQIISSLIYFQTKNVKEKKGILLLGEIRTKIDAMALMHEMLYSRESLKNFYLKDFITNLTENIEKIAVSEIAIVKYNLNIENFDLDVDKYLILGMLTVEIINNAIKHAFAGCTDPQIKLELWKENEFAVYKIS